MDSTITSVRKDPASARPAARMTSRAKPTTCPAPLARANDAVNDAAHNNGLRGIRIVIAEGFGIPSWCFRVLGFRITVL
jgi:hypothetical protein